MRRDLQEAVAGAAEEEGEEEVTSGGGQMLQGLMGHLGSHEKVFVCLIFLSWFVFVFDIYVPFIF